MGTFFGIEIGRRGVMAQQRALETTGHNVANSSTKGYSRQEVILSTTSPFSYPGMGVGQRGTGVQAQGIRRIREDFLDYQYRNEVQSLGRWEVRQNTVEKLEAIFNEPSDQGLSKLLSRFFDGWQNVARNPDTEGARSALRQEGMALADAFRHLASQINDLKADTCSSIVVRVNEINSLTRQIRDLNAQIVKAESGNMAANDLRDRRDLLLDQLARVVPIQVEEDGFGAVSIVVRDHTLLSGQKINELSADAASGKVTWPDGAEYRFGSQPYGELEGLLEAVREDATNPGLIQNYEERLDTLAKSIIEKVNDLHKQGVGLEGDTDLEFFVGSGAGSIQINPDLAGSDGLSKIAAASADGAPGDGSNALLIAQLRHQAALNGIATFGDYYSALVAELGVQGQEAQRMVENQEILASEIDNRRQAVSGVSLDEEMVNMIRFQQAYNASARLITAVDEMLEVLISRTGLVGR
ncbi:MAG: flagellar hook-associated protein FlgK [bacterium]